MTRQFFGDLKQKTQRCRSSFDNIDYRMKKGIQSIEFFQQLKMAHVLKPGEAERLTPNHPDWCWLQTPMNQLLKERSAPFDASVRTKQSFNRFLDV